MLRRLFYVSVLFCPCESEAGGTSTNLPLKNSLRSLCEYLRVWSIRLIAGSSFCLNLPSTVVFFCVADIQEFHIGTIFMHERKHHVHYSVFPPEFCSWTENPSELILFWVFQQLFSRRLNTNKQIVFFFCHVSDVTLRIGIVSFVGDFCKA